MQLLNNCDTHLDAVIWYKQSNVIIEIHSDSSYLPDPKECSRADGQLSFITKWGQPMMNNVAVHVVSIIIRNVISSKSKDELAALYMNEEDGAVIRNMLEEMVHSRPETPLQTENSTAKGIVNKTISQRRSKVMDVYFYFMNDW